MNNGLFPGVVLKAFPSLLFSILLSVIFTSCVPEMEVQEVTIEQSVDEIGPPPGNTKALSNFSGQQLYEQNCSTCHTADAQGVPSKASKTRAEIIGAIYNNIGQMGFLKNELTSKQIDMIEAYLAGFKVAEPVKEPVVVVQPLNLDGKDLYATNCASCHMALETSTKKNKTAVEIQNAIYNNGVMKAIQALIDLKPEQVQVISDVLKVVEPVKEPVVAPVELPFLNQDIGEVAVKGSLAYSNGVYTILSAGFDIWGTSDSLNYSYLSLSGDGSIIAKVDYLQNTHQWIKSGLMIRESLAPGAKHASTVLTGANGIRAFRRSVDDGVTSQTGLADYMDEKFVKIERKGSSFISSMSSDGVSWKVISTVNISMKQDVYIGILVAGPGNIDGMTTESKLSNLSHTGNVTKASAPVVVVQQPLNVDGKDLYATNCASCHMALDTSTKKNKTAAEIQNAIYNNSVMKGIQALVDLKPEQVDAISVALKAEVVVQPINLDGKDLYATNCASCHMALESSTKKNKTSAEIQNAIYNNAVMKGIAALTNLTMAQVDAISAALISAEPAPAPAPVELPFLNQDIGGPAIKGSLTYNNGVYTVVSSGLDIWGTSDSFNYSYLALSGDGSMIAKVDSLQNVHPWAKSAIMIRESLTPGAKHASTVYTTENQVRAFVRVNESDVSNQFLPASYNNEQFIKIERKGNNFISSLSVDGVNWKMISTTSISMKADVFIGLAVSSHVDSVTTSSKLSNVSYTGNVTKATELPPVVVVQEPLNLDGTSLYTANCASCHSSLATSTKKNKTAAEIQNAIYNNSVMKGIQALVELKPEQVQAISDVLKFTEPVVVQQPLSGEELYQKNCIACHSITNGRPAKAGSTATEITQAIDLNKGGMGYLKTVLSSTEINYIAEYLKGPFEATQVVVAAGEITADYSEVLPTRFYIANKMRNIFGTGDSTVNGYISQIERKPGFFGGSCTEKYEGCAGNEEDNNNGSMKPTTNVARRGYMLKVCKLILGRSVAVSNALAKAGLNTSSTASASNISKLYDIFYPGQDADQAAVDSLISVYSSSRSTGQSTANSWRNTMYVMCASPLFETF